MMQIVKVPEAPGDLFWGSWRSCYPELSAAVTFIRAWNQNANHREKCVLFFMATVVSVAPAKKGDGCRWCAGQWPPGSHSQFLWTFAQQKGELTPSSALTKSSRSCSTSALCWQILKGISLSLLEAVCSEVIIGNLLMVKTQETSCCLPRKKCPLSETFKTKQPTE